MNFWEKWIKNKNKVREEPFTGQIPLKILFKVLSQRKKVRPSKAPIFKTQRHYLHHTLPGLFYSFFKKIATTIKKMYLFFICSPLKHYSNLFLLFIIYFLIWHPGLDNRELPKHSVKSPVLKNIPVRPDIVASTSVYVEIDRNDSWLDLFMKEKKIASYPVAMTPLLQGKYKVLEIKEYPQGMILAILGNSDHLQKDFILLKGSQLKIESPVKYCIEVDDSFWETLHPYLREESIVVIK